MLVEIPDPEVILSVIIAFLVGLGGLFGYYKLRPMVKSNESGDSSQSERLEYYERQLIDMKIRLDALEIEGVGEKSTDPNLELKQFLEKIAKNNVRDMPLKIEEIAETKPGTQQESNVEIEPEITPLTPSLDHVNASDYVLHLITKQPMTSRDIQITLKKSREHTSRLMKKLFDDGYVERNTDSKPYRYFISEKGKQKIGVLESSPTTV
ncbi:MAG: MarR family transcriptional regulator [Candidatus Dadabacteria bacterium]|nr:MarR family transcriptional regulator [Candidatus Dadabacteria bacterium]NIQ13099.1 MarR family transcriptional regulator [Candidatus Dadabacteria bacterium]